MKIKIIIWLTLVLFISITNAKADSDPPSEGKIIFTSRCASCHNVNKVLTGPALAGVDERHSIEWIINFVHSSQTMIRKGDKEAVALYEKFNKIPMPDHPDLTDENIKNIVAFIKSESKSADKVEAPLAKPSVKESNYLSMLLKTDFWLLMGILVAILLLIATIILAAKVNSLKKEIQNRALKNNL